ncbi:cbb3-type cytochrome c oxidase subunit 3 [Devosia sp.]|uniref:cbb3-type cytochrome c oxidase subunit 3 n=1 Tax=Devosia sp. TaxID=1871048 RepID=UPI0035B26E1A
MDISHYDTLRHFADSWGLVYMMAIFVAVAVFLLRPGAKAHADAAARIPLDDAHPLQRGNDR